MNGITNTGTSISNVQNHSLGAKGIVPMEWSKEQLEILQQCHEEQIANEACYSSLDEPHGVSCNCVECN